MSPSFAIKAENVSKLYRLGSEPRINRTLRDVIAGSFHRINRSFKSHNGYGRRETDFWALSEVSFQIEPGEVVGIIGRNGAGKSTLLKILSRITEPSRGRIEICGRVCSLLEVGTGFHPELSGRENIYLNGSILGMSRREIARKFDEIVAFSELEGFIDTPVKHYSSGMYVRLAFAVAAHLEPEVLLLDEVLAVGDAAFQKKCLGKMSEVARRGRTVLFVSHNTAALLNFCQRGILLEKGRAVVDGKIEPVIQHYFKSLRTTTTSDLSKHEDRQGRGHARFTQIRFEDGRGNVTERAVAGDPLMIVLNYRSTEDRPLLNCRASIAFHDALGQVLFNCSSELTISDPITLPSSGTIRCLIPRFPLSQNQYLLTVFLEVNREIEDWILSAIELDVVDGDFYGTGRLYPDGWRGKGVLVPHQWIVDCR